MRTLIAIDTDGPVADCFWRRGAIILFILCILAILLQTRRKHSGGQAPALRWPGRRASLTVARGPVPRKATKKNASVPVARGTGPRTRRRSRRCV